MTSRPVTTTSPSAPVSSGPGERPHLPPVATSTTTERRRRKAPLAWLPWALLGLLVLTLLGAALLAKAAGGSDSAARTPAQSGEAASSAQADGSNAALSAGGQDMLALRGGPIGSLDGQRASGTAKVEYVVADEGFWVGTSAADRVFVFLTPQARQSAGESGFTVEAGQRVSLEGTVKPSSAEFAQAAGVADGEGSRQLVQQGGYVEATEVRLAQ